MKSLILSLFILIVTISLKAQDSLFMQNQNGSISIGVGEQLYESGNKIHSNANLSLNLDIKIKNKFYLKIGGDLLEHNSYETRWIVYFGPDFKVNILHKKFDFTIDFGILGIVGAAEEGLGAAASLFLNPSIRYYIRNFSMGLELRNYLGSGFTATKSNYFFNPLIIFSYSF